MSRVKVFISILMALILIALSGVSVWAAPGGQQEEPTTIIGVVEEIDFDEETNTVLVTLVVDETTGETQTVRLSLETATALELVTEDEEGNPIANEAMIGQTVEINLDDVIPDEEGEEPLTEHPVALALAEYFNGLLGLEDGEIMGYHEDGFGFGVIAQACWMSLSPSLDGTVTVGEILEAKKSHTLSSISITLPDGTTTTAKSWGQFKKAVLGNEKAKKNLGAIMSGRAGDDETTTKANQGQGKGEKDKGTGEEDSGPSGKGKNKGGKPDTPPGQLENKKDKDKGGGPPAEPPGKVKNKDKGGGKGKDK